MRKLLFTMMLLCGVYVHSQYYGVPIFKEGFDETDFPASWTQQNTTKDDPCKWIPDNTASTPFSNIDAVSSKSLSFTIGQGNKPYLTLTSPEIDLSNKKELIAGFYGFEFRVAMRNLNFIFRITKDNGTTWTNLFDSSKGDSYNGVATVSKWNLYKYDLPSEFNGSKVKLQFVIDGLTFTGYDGMPGYLDGVFISERYPIDLAIDKVYNFSSDAKDPTLKVFTASEPISIDFTNKGANPVTELELYFQINEQAPMVEKYIPTQPIQVGQKVKYTFTAKADLSAPLGSFTLKTGVRKDGDGDMSNNEILSYAQNIVSGIPYYPKFLWDEEGVPTVDADNWETDGISDGFWELDRNDGIWYVDNEYSREYCNAYLISRPVMLEKGKTYEIRFNAWVDAETEYSPLNMMNVCVSQQNDIDAEMTYIWGHEAIGKQNAMNSFARYTAEETKAHYFMFNCTSEPTPDFLKILPLSVTEVKNFDIGIMSLLSPSESTYKFTSAETVSILLRNFGSMAVKASDVTLSMQLNNGEVINQPLTADLPAGAIQEFTFTQKMDFSDLNLKKELTIKANYASDQAVENNILISTLHCVVSGVPYIPDFGIDRYPTKEASLWTAVDNNNDQYTFSLVSDGALNTYVFSYGGNTTRPTIVLPKSDEQLYSRSVWLEAGSSYRLSYLSKVAKAEPIPVKTLLYSIDGEQRTFVKELNSVELTSTSYMETLKDIQIEKSGIYKLCFSVVMNTPIDYKVYLGGFKLTKINDSNLMLTDIVLSSSTISCYGKSPVGVIVTNTGKKEVNSFTIKGNSVSAGEKQTVFNRSIAPGENALCYFSEDFAFNGAEEELLTVTVDATQDLDKEDNSKTIMVKYVTSLKVPYTSGFYSRPDGWLTINNNRDDSRFEFVSGSGFRFKNADQRIPNDLLVSRCITLEKGKLYRTGISSKVAQAGDSASYDIYVYNYQTKEKILIAEFRNLTDSKGAPYYGYFKVPTDGDYCICYDIKEHTNSVIFYNQFEVKEMTNQPDLRLIEVVSPVKDAVFSADETLTVKFSNDGQDYLGTSFFTCEIGDKIYHSIRTGTISSKMEYEASFLHVDLSSVGEYKMKISAIVSYDATPENNTLEYVLRSLPVVNVSIVGLASPQSGVLSAEEPIVVKMKNSGKGDLNRIPLSAIITDKDGGKTTLTGTTETALPQGETIEYTFSKKVDMYAEGTYLIEVTSSLEGDVDAADNTYKTSVVSSHKDFDAGVSQLVAPKSGLLGEEIITVKMTNYTEVDMYDVPVHSVIKPVSDATKTPIVLEGLLDKLPANTSADFTFTQKVNMKPVGEYEIKSYTSVKNDVNLQNDTLTVIVRSLKKDAGVVEIVSPETGYDLHSQEITIRVKNFGEAPLSQIPVRYKVGSIPQLGTIAQTLEPGATIDYTFSTPYEFESYKVYTITAYTELEDDFDNINDVFTKEIENKKLNSISSVNIVQTSVYPNPAKETVRVDAGDALIHTLSVWTNEGTQLIRKDSIESVSCQLQLALPSGNYILKIETNKGIVYNKLIIR